MQSKALNRMLLRTTLGVGLASLLLAGCQTPMQQQPSSSSQQSSSSSQSSSSQSSSSSGSSSSQSSSSSSQGSAGAPSMPSASTPSSSSGEQSSPRQTSGQRSSQQGEETTTASRQGSSSGSEQDRRQGRTGSGGLELPEYGETDSAGEQTTAEAQGEGERSGTGDTGQGQNQNGETIDYGSEDGPFGELGKESDTAEAGTGTSTGTGSSERVEELEAELEEGYGEFDGIILGERGRIEEDARKSGDDEGQENQEEQRDASGSTAQSGGTGEGQEEVPAVLAQGGSGNAQPGDYLPSGNSTSGDGSGEPAQGNSIPDDIPSGDDDDVVAQQLREAAMSEPDPELREKLWDEYRSYKGID